MPYSIRPFLGFLFCFLFTLPLQAWAATDQKAQSPDIASAVKVEDVFRYIVRSPRPDYPYEARREHLTGAGIFIVRIDQAAGNVVCVITYVSTGQAILDQSTVETLHHWQFKRGTPFKAVKVDMTYTEGGGSWGMGVVETESHLNDALARYLGKGLVVSAPIPKYPGGKTWDFKEGRGVYELHVTKAGAVSSVKVLKSSKDQTFDHLATEALTQWRFSRGPLVIELPLRFVLTPASYSVSLAR